MSWIPPPPAVEGAGPHAVRLYLDESGTPGVAGVFLTAGVLVSGDAKAVSAEWDRYCREAAHPQKGRRYGVAQLLGTADFIIPRPVVPIAVHSRLSVDDAAIFAGSSRRENRSSAAFQRSVPPQVVARFEELLSFRLGGDRLRPLIASGQLHPTVASHLKRVAGATWKTDLNAKGPLARLADVVCAMYAKRLDRADGGAWAALSLRFAQDGRSVPQYLASDVTAEIEAQLVRTEQILAEKGG